MNVSTEAQLQNAVSTAPAGTTILIAPGTYNLTSTLYLDVNDLTLRGATNDRDDVVLVGKGMTNGNYGAVRFGVWTNAQRITIAHLTIRDVYEHHIILNPGAESPRIYNVRLVDAGSLFIKANSDNAGGGVDNGRVEYSILEYSNTAPDYYTNGVAVLGGSGWVVRNNLFRNIRAPQGQLAGPAVLFWQGSRDPVVDGNTFINCQREIALGLEAATPNDNTGGIVRNNFIYRASSMSADAAIYVGDSPDTQVLHNTILVNGTYSTPIEYRFPDTTGVVISNNLLDGSISVRDGASGAVTANYTSATASMFVNPAAGDLHLTSAAAAVIDRVTALSNASTDWDGESRPQGSAADYGADERASATPPPNQAPTVSLTSPANGAVFAVPATITLAATASDADGSVAAVDFYVGGTIIGSASASPYSMSWEDVAAGSYSVRAVARDNAGASTTSSSISITVNAPPVAGLPSPWLATDIGSPAVGGSATYASGTFTIEGAGDNIWGTADQFQFAYRTLSGDGEIVAQVASLQNTNSWAKAGVMIRETLTAASRHAFAAVTPENGLTFRRRVTTGGSSASTSGGAGAAPHWVRLVRSGTTFSAYQSTTGTSWTLIGSETIPMATSVYVGLAVTSRNVSTLMTTTFTDTAVTEGTSNIAPSVSITSPSSGVAFNSPATISVSASASDSDGTIASVTFYAGSTPIGSDTSDPYSVTWSNVPAGSYMLTALAVDDDGASWTSGAVSITVGSSSALPRQLVFTASADHATNVTSYTMDMFTAGANSSTAIPVSTQNLGKPAVVNGDISVDIAALVQALSAGSYFATVTAIGPGGITRSAPSNTFNR